MAIRYENMSHRHGFFIHGQCGHRYIDRRFYLFGRCRQKRLIPLSLAQADRLAVLVRANVSAVNWTLGSLYGGSADYLDSMRRAVLIKVVTCVFVLAAEGVGGGGCGERGFNSND